MDYMSLYFHSAGSLHMPQDFLAACHKPNSAASSGVPACRQAGRDVFFMRGFGPACRQAGSGNIINYIFIISFTAISGEPLLLRNMRFRILTELVFAVVGAEIIDLSVILV